MNVNLSPRRIATSIGRYFAGSVAADDVVGSAYAALMSDGYCVIRACVPPDVCEAAASAVDAFKTRHHEVCAPNMDGFGHLYRVVNLHLAIDELANAFTSETRGLAVCDQFFGARTALYTSLYYERGSEQDLHRDTPYFCTRPGGRYLGMWLALDDVDDGNGPLKVVPGSHALPPLDVAAMARSLFPDPRAVPSSSPEGWACYQDAVQRQCRDAGLSEQTIHVSAGDVVIWHPEMLHGGSPHRDQQRSRRSLVTHVTPAGTPVFHMDVFFDPEKQVPATPSWGYRTLRGRQIAIFDSVDFGHEYARSVASLR